MMESLKIEQEPSESDLEIEIGATRVSTRDRAALHWHFGTMEMICPLAFFHSSVQFFSGKDTISELAIHYCHLIPLSMCHACFDQTDRKKSAEYMRESQPVVDKTVWYMVYRTGFHRLPARREDLPSPINLPFFEKPHPPLGQVFLYERRRR